VSRILTYVGLVFGEHSHHVVIEGSSHELLRDLAGTETVKLLGHVDSGAFADNKYVAKEFLKLGMNDGSINRQETRSNLGRESLPSAHEAVAEGRGCRKYRE
jgi:hypothetical protein